MVIGERMQSWQPGQLDDPQRRRMLSPAQDFTELPGHERVAVIGRVQSVVAGNELAQEPAGVLVAATVGHRYRL